MLTAISRYGVRVPPETDRIIAASEAEGRMLEGPELVAFETAFARRLGGGHAVATSYGRMAGYDIFRALELPPGSQAIFPALTFWVMPEMARRAGLEVVFADVDPITFNLDPAALERAITPRTRLVVPTHVYGLPCEMNAIIEIARRHGLYVVEDCAHALGASYHGRPAGTFGDAALFSFQILKPLNTFGGGAAFTRRNDLARRLRALAAARPLPPLGRVRKRLRLGRLERALMRPGTFSLSVFPVLWAASFWKARPDVYVWEKVRPLDPFPVGYQERYSNVQARLGLAGLDHLDEWSARTQRNAARLSEALRGMPGVVTPPEPSDRVHAFYQYAAYVPIRDDVVRRALRAGLDLEYHHMDVCSDLPLFGAARVDAWGARRTTQALQVPVHAGLDDSRLELVVKRLLGALGWARSAEMAAPSYGR